MLFSTPLAVLTTALWFSSLVPIVHAGWINNLSPRASGAPSCTVCPPQDLAGTTLGDSDTSSNPIVCYYPVKAQDPDKFFCKYHKNSGALKNDQDKGHCPSNAPTSCSSEATKRDRVAAQPQPAAVPNSIRSIKALRKATLKHAIRQAHEAEIFEGAEEEEMA